MDRMPQASVNKKPEMCYDMRDLMTKRQSLVTI